MIKEYQKGSEDQLSKYFNAKEFHCHCRYPECQITYIDTDLIDYLEKKREMLDEPLEILSGFRCTRHNREVGGKPGSYHLLGKAADLEIPGKNILEFAYLFEDASGLGRYSEEKFIHVDVRHGVGPNVPKSRWKG